MGFSDSDSDSDEETRVVKSVKEKKWDGLNDLCTSIRQKIKNGDWGKF